MVFLSVSCYKGLIKDGVVAHGWGGGGTAGSSSPLVATHELIIELAQFLLILF